MKNKLIWVIVISAIFLNLGATRYELTTNLNLIDHPFYGFFLDPFSNFRYGHYIARKFFLVVIAFFIFAYWLSKQKNISLQIRSNLKYIIVIGVVLVLSRILTYGFWFYNDDIRFFHFHQFALTLPEVNLQASWGPIGPHPIALFLLALNFFGTNYFLYNTLGLFFYFLAGVGIFVLINKLTNNKPISLGAAIFFLTTPTYFQGRLLIGEVINSPFTLLLVVLSLYLLLRNFIPGALIFAAAALEYGVAKTYFIALPFTLFTLFFFKSKPPRLIFFMVAVWFISLIYSPVFFRAQTSASSSMSGLFTSDQLFVFGDVLLSLNLPYGLSYPLVHFLSLILSSWIYITAVLGFLIIVFFIMVAIFSYFKKQSLAAKLIIIGLSIIIPCAAIASFMGVRVDHNVAKLVAYHNNGFIPMGATAYGFFPAFGLTLVLVGLKYITNKKIFKILAIILILINLITSIAFDYRWFKLPYAFPQRQFDEQLQKILPRDGISKYIYVPSKQRVLFEGVRTFASVFQGDQEIHVFSDAGDFVKALKEEKAQHDHIYFLISNGKPKFEIYDYSDKIRSIPYDDLTTDLESLSKKLTPDVEFLD